jgi:periplasmic protein TonB
MLILFGTAALLIFLFSLDLGWSNLLTSNRNDLVFEHRNHDYGAYALRREHHLNLFYALLLGIGVVGSGLFFLSLASGPPVLKPITEAITIFDASIFDMTDPKAPDEEPAPQRERAAAPPMNDVEFQVVNEPVEDDPDLSIPPSNGPVDPLAGPGTPPQGPGGGSGQGNKPEPEEPTITKVFEFVQKMPEFPGGTEELMAFIQRNVEYDELCKERGVEGTIYVSFVILADGHVGKIEIIRGLLQGKALGQSVVETIGRMPRWIPGEQNGVPVAVRKVIPVKFSIK